MHSTANQNLCNDSVTSQDSVDEWCDDSNGDYETHKDTIALNIEILNDNICSGAEENEVRYDICYAHIKRSH